MVLVLVQLQLQVLLLQAMHVLVQVQVLVLVQVQVYVHVQVHTCRCRCRCMTLQMQSVKPLSSFRFMNIQRTVWNCRKLNTTERASPAADGNILIIAAVVSLCHLFIAACSAAGGPSAGT